MTWKDLQEKVVAQGVTDAATIERLSWPGGTAPVSVAFTAPPPTPHEAAMSRYRARRAEAVEPAAAVAVDLAPDVALEPGEDDAVPTHNIPT